MKVLIAKICGSTFALISIYCSALLWWSFAEHTKDQVIAAIIGSGFVACQYLFYANRNYIASTALLVISVIATMGWIESCYDSLKTTELISDSSYSEKTKTLTELNNSLALQNLSAKNDLANTSINFTGRANRTLAKAKQTQTAIKQIEHEIEQLKNANPSSKKSGSAIANNLADYRWVLWFLLAAMVDLIPRICYKIVATESAATTVTATDTGSVSTLTKSVTETITPTATQPLQKSLQPTQHKDATVLSIVTPTIAESVTTTATECDELTPVIALEIKANQYGEKPSQSAVLRKHKIRHARTQNIFKELVQMNIIQPHGQSYKRIQSSKDQEQTA